MTGNIAKRYGKQQLKVKTLSEADFMKHLELAIQFGTPFLFENVDEELDPMLDPILEKNTYRRRRRTQNVSSQKESSFEL